MSRRGRKIVPTREGEFVGTRLTGDHVTLWIEGKDQDGPSVSGTALDVNSLDKLVRRLIFLSYQLKRKARDQAEQTGRQGPEPPPT